MDEISVRLKSLEWKIRGLCAVVVLLSAVIAAQMLGWLPTLRTSEVRTEKIVLASEGGLHRSIEISERGVHIVDHDGGGETWLTAPSGGDPTGLVMTGRSGHTEISPGEVSVTAREGGTVEVRGGARPGMLVLGGKDGQVDIGPGFATVSGAGGVTAILAGRDALGLRVLDDKGQPVAPR